MILRAHFKILDDVTQGNSFLGLNKNSKGLWFDFKRNFLPNKNSVLSLSLHNPNYG